MSRFSEYLATKNYLNHTNCHSKERINQMKIGDTVRINDFSFSQMIDVDGRQKGMNNTSTDAQDVFTVAAADCYIPSSGDNRNEFRPKSFPADTIIVSNTHRVIAFICSKFLDPLRHTIIIDGKSIEISDESYNALRKSLLQE